MRKGCFLTRTAFSLRALNGKRRRDAPPLELLMPQLILQRIDEVLHVDAHGMAGADLVPL